jgi:ABC-2 type transport system ATP-binding protein
MNTVELENIAKSFGRHTAIDDLTLNVPQGCVYGFIGPDLHPEN